VSKHTCAFCGVADDSTVYWNANYQHSTTFYCIKALTSELAAARALLSNDAITEPCGHARRWTAYRNGVDPNQGTFCLFCELAAARAACENCQRLLRHAVGLLDHVCGWEMWCEAARAAGGAG